VSRSFRRGRFHSLLDCFPGVRDWVRRRLEKGGRHRRRLREEWVVMGGGVG
jgi:hypothetical protein